MSERDYTRVCLNNEESICEDMFSPDSLNASENSGLELQTNISSNDSILSDDNNLSNGDNSLVSIPLDTSVGIGYRSNATFLLGNRIFHTEWEYLEAYSEILDEEFGYSSDSSLSQLTDRKSVV